MTGGFVVERYFRGCEVGFAMCLGCAPNYATELARTINHGLCNPSRGVLTLTVDLVIAMGKKRKILSQEEIWDDSALIESWDEALAEYKVPILLSLQRMRKLANINLPSCIIASMLVASGSKMSLMQPKQVMI